MSLLKRSTRVLLLLAALLTASGSLAACGAEASSGDAAAARQTVTSFIYDLSVSHNSSGLCSLLSPSEQKHLTSGYAGMSCVQFFTMFYSHSSKSLADGRAYTEACYKATKKALADAPVKISGASATLSWRPAGVAPSYAVGVSTFYCSATTVKLIRGPHGWLLNSEVPSGG